MPDKKRILIVDDDESMARAIERALGGQERYIIETAHDGIDAGEKMFVHRPDLAIVDMRMPHVDGYQLCAAIRGDSGNKDIKILAISGVLDTRYKDQTQKIAADDFLPKPFNNEELRAKVEKLLGIGGVKGP